MGIEDLLFICPLLRHLAGKPNEGISVENFEHLVDGDFEIDGEFMSWDINAGDTGGTDMVNWKEIIHDSLDNNGFGICGHAPCWRCIFRMPIDGCLLSAMKVTERFHYVLRHLGSPNVVTNWQDEDEIKARIAEMLDEETRRKFMGEPEKPTVEYLPYYLAEPYKRPAGGNDIADKWGPAPDLSYVIRREVNGKHNDAEDTVAAFLDNNLMEKVLEFLNGEAE